MSLRLIVVMVHLVSSTVAGCDGRPLVGMTMVYDLANVRNTVGYGGGISKR